MKSSALINSAQELMQEKTYEIYEFSIKASNEISQYMDATQALLQPLISSSAKSKFKTSIDSLSTLSSIFIKIIAIVETIKKIPKPSPNSLSDSMKQNALLKTFNFEIQDFQSKIPPLAEIQKFLTQKPCSDLLKAINSLNKDISYWIRMPYFFAQQWYMYWEYIISIEPPSATRSVYRECRNAFQIQDQQETFKKNAVHFKKQLDLLKQYTAKTDMIFNDSMNLHTCAKGDVITGSFDRTESSPAYLFLFEEKIAILEINKKRVRAQNTINSWIVPSTMFPKSKGIVDVLGTDFSFAFQPQEGERENFAENWSLLMSDKPQDFSIYMPVQLNEGSQNMLEWWQIED